MLLLYRILCGSFKEIIQRVAQYDACVVSPEDAFTMLSQFIPSQFAKMQIDGLREINGIKATIAKEGRKINGRKEVRSQLETNLFGLLWVTQAIIPVMREQKSGHIIQLSSALGLVTLPTMGVYSASKFAVEGLSETLAAEVSGFGIKVTIVEPNGFSTDFGTASISQSETMDIYNEVRNALYVSQREEHSGVPEATADAILNLVDTANPPLRMILGKVGFPLVKQAYESRLATWEEWQDVSAAAHGK